MTTYDIPGVGQLAPGRPFTLAGIKYPANWLELATPEDLADRGITVAQVDEQLPSPATPEDRKASLIANTWSECETRLQTASVAVNLGGSAFYFGLDRETRENIAGIVNAINAERSGLLPPGTVPNPRPFAPKGSPLLGFSHEALAAVGAAVMNGKDAYMAAYFAHKAAINAATELAQLTDYDVTTNWPATS